jgi:hypothetical protein
MSFDDETDCSPEMNDLVAKKIALFRSIVLPYPRHVLFHSRCDYLQKLGVANRGKPQMGLRMLAPSGSGKSTAALEYKALVERRSPPTDAFVPIVYVALDSASTSKRLMVQILHALGDPLAERGTEQSLRSRAIDYLRRLGVQLLIIDEVQHLNFRSSAKADVTDALKSFLDAGVTPIVFLGTDEARPMFESNLQLNGRLLAPLDMPKLEPSKSEDRDLFASFVWGLCEGIAERRVLDRNEALQHAIKLVTGIHSLAEIDHERTITSVAAKLKIPRGKLRSLVRVGGVRADPVMGGEHRRYDEVRIDELNTLVTDRISASSLAKMFQLKDRYIIALAKARVLDAMVGLAPKLYQEAQFHQSLAIPYLTGLAEKVLRHDIDEHRMSLAEVMARLAPGPKPWASIFALAEAGDLEGGLGSVAPTGLEASKLTLSSSFANKLISGEVELERPFWPCDPEAGYGVVRSHDVATSLSEAEETLGLYPRDMQALLRQGYIDVHEGRVTWISIKKCARAIIGTRELAARAEIEPLKLGVEAAKRGLERLAPRAGIWSRGTALAVFDLPRDPSDRFKPPKPGLSVRIGL